MGGGAAWKGMQLVGLDQQDPISCGHAANEGVHQSLSLPHNSNSLWFNCLTGCLWLTDRTILRGEW